MRIRIMLAASIATLAVMLVPAAPGSADSNIWGECPDGYVPLAGGIGLEEDRNGNGVVCVKFAGSHAIVKDDPSGQRYRCNGFPTPPPECISNPDGSVFVADDFLD